MSFIDAKVIFVDTERLTLDAIATDMSELFRDVGYSNLGTSGEGIEIVPDIGSAVVLEKTDRVTTVYKAYSMRTIDGNFHRITNAPDHLTSLPGDVSLTAQGGAGVAAARGNHLSLLSGDLAQVHLLGVANLIRGVAANYDLIGGGFRFYSVTENGEVITRMYLSPSDAHMTQGNDEALVDNFEFQIEVKGNNLTIFAGSVEDPVASVASSDVNAGSVATRRNNIILSFNCQDGLTLRLGENIQDDSYATEIYYGKTGVIKETMFAPDGTSIYARTVARDSVAKDRVTVTETITGDVERIVLGNVNETIEGDMIRTVKNIMHNEAEAISSKAGVLTQEAGVVAKTISN